MTEKKSMAIRKPCKRATSSKTVDVRSSLARKMLHMVVQFDLAYDKLKIYWKEPCGIPEQEGLELMHNAQQAVQNFSTFMEEFSEKVGFDYNPPKNF